MIDLTFPKKIFILSVFCFLAVLFLLFPEFLSAQTYKALQPLQGVPQPTVGGGAPNFTNYIGGLMGLLIGVAAVLAIIYIMIGGIQYVTTDSIGNKQGGKEMITNALLGLLLALASWLILNTINPNLLSMNLNLGGGGEGAYYEHRDDGMR